MRRYFFDIKLSNAVAEDEEGIVLPNLEAVQREALRTLADMAKELIEFPASMSVQVRDDAGSVMRARIVFEIERTN
jgi:uncharacterized protein DUF6894